MRKTIVWFWDDLRLTDNPALYFASKKGSVIPIFILTKDLNIGSARKWWVYKSLKNLESELRVLGGKLLILSGNDALSVLENLIFKTKADAVYWNRRYEPVLSERDKVIEKKLLDKGLEVNIFNGTLLHDPEKLKTKDGKPYSIFTPFWKKFLEEVKVESPLQKPEKIVFAAEEINSLSVDDLGLRPEINWYSRMEQFWDVSEEGALKRLEAFITKSLDSYRENRDYPYIDGTSLMSPYLANGNISPRQIWHSVMNNCINKLSGLDESSEKIFKRAESFLRQIAWREFSYHILYHNPQIVFQNLRREFDDFPWRWEKDEHYQKWTKGLTGIPIIDAGMRQLWAIGWMHNRVRMVVASYLTKNLLIHWKIGAEWFWDTLVDGDLANNIQGWQWTAGCGADAAPFFRIFNPILQSKKFDPYGEYIKKWIPELKKLPVEYIHEPWKTPTHLLKSIGLKYGKDYPIVTISLEETSKEANKIYQEMKTINKRIK